ncbi:MAG: DEAD/DEAH box helicase family protein [Bacteroidales bacterium]|nr:DEAD/DEAH box helicase family protein [Bacteroidales bacterium]
MELIDNVTKTLRDDLTVEIKEASKISMAACCFSIYAFQELKEQLKDIQELRFIFTSPTFTSERIDKQRREFYIPRIDRERTLYGSPFEVKLRNQLTQKAIAIECANWIKQKVRFKSNTTNNILTGFINVANDEVCTYTPVNGFTTTDLGCERGNSMMNFVNKVNGASARKYLRMFNELWNNEKDFSDVTDDIIDHISNIYRENSPEFIYFVTLYNIFNEFLEDISEDVLPNEATGFKDSQIWNKLYDFQKDAALAIINKLEKYNGCILADSVGLGKTFSALAVIKYYETRNKNVLVLCPKKLCDNWMTYRTNYITNPIAGDRLAYTVLFHSDLSRVGGRSNGLELEKINWGNFDLVVIDESHNFRNGGKLSRDDDDDNPRENRYLRLMNKVIRAGVKTKVLMLSATPVNNRFNDLKNQLQLAYEGDTKRMDALLNTNTSIDDIFRQAQKAYNIWAKLPNEKRNTERLLGMLSFDFFEVLDSVTIARSRKHIEAYYNTEAVGKFPLRLPPISRRPSLTDLPSAINYNEIFNQLQKLNLAIYTPSEFILPSKMSKYALDPETHGAGLSLVGREMGIRRIMCILMLKRLESSVNSFRLTLTRLLKLISNTIDTIDRHEAYINVEEVDDYDFDIEDSDNDAFVGTKKNRIALEDIDYISWRQYLQRDKEELELTRLMLEDITPEHDSKLQQLITDLRDKFAHPINGENKKVLIFTAFSDTAVYLYDNLAKPIKQKYGMDTALVTGDVEARSTLKLKEKLDFNKVLTLFSPISKEKASIYPNINEEIEVLIATDCISEGQNLQDCDYLINYDIHWNPVRIIQRFGRIDRIGSKNDVIQLVNYWPDMTLDEYIDLKGRVEARMKVSVLTSTGDDNPISPEEKGDLEYRKAQLKKLQEEVVDIEEMNNGVSIMDLGLNEFRLDLLEYMKSHEDVEHTPFGLHAVVGHNEFTEPGVIFVLKNRNKGVNIDKKNRLHPFYIVYLRNDGSVVVNHLSPKELLDKFRSLCKGKNMPQTALCREFNKETRDGLKMAHYSKLLGDAINSIITVKENSDIDSFLEGVQGELFTKEIKGLDDFELICFLVIK